MAVIEFRDDEEVSSALALDGAPYPVRANPIITISYHHQCLERVLRLTVNSRVSRASLTVATIC